MWDILKQPFKIMLFADIFFQKKSLQSVDLRILL